LSRDIRAYGKVLNDTFYCGFCGHPHILKDYKYGIPTRCNKCGKYTAVMHAIMSKWQECKKNGIVTPPTYPKDFWEYLFKRKELETK
jgi:transcription elongation factor Elf1